ncbi:MAG: adenylate kinase [Ruminococcaceae bacterium]|nr:adenylate kinase [Oscillospiraceae bacterium]
MKIIFLGAPGAGKGTQAEIVAQKAGIPTISTGVILREAIKNKTPLGVSAQSYIEKGQLVPDELVIDILTDRLSQDDCKNGYILDGFPRTIAQAEALDKMNITIDKVVNIFVPDEKIVERLAGRRSCAGCGATYHVVYNPSKDGVHCSNCGKELTQRSDDKPETILNRLEVYHSQTAPLEEFYRNRGILCDVEGQEELADTTALTLKALELK